MIRLLLVLLPLFEIAGFILVGKALGVLPTLGLVLLAGLVGVALVRRAGRESLVRVQSELEAGRDPGERLVGAFLDLLAGVLLIVPGFLSDGLALLLLLPPVRARAWRALKSRVRSFRFGGRARSGRVIELDSADFRRAPEPDGPRLPPGSSPWADPR